MLSPTKEEQRQTILYYWKKGVHEAPKIHSLTEIPIRTIYYNLKKIKEQEDVTHRGGNGRKKIITGTIARKIGQFIRWEPNISVNSIVNKLNENGTTVSYMTVLRHLHNLGYKNSLPLAVPMLTASHKKNRVIWAKKHLKDDWRRTVFSDETAFQLFRNTIKWWYKGARPIRPIPKDRSKIMAWGGFSMKGKTSLFCFDCIMNGNFLCRNSRKTSSGNKRTVGEQVALSTG
jgi:Transposase